MLDYFRKDIDSNGVWSAENTVTNRSWLSSKTNIADKGVSNIDSLTTVTGSNERCAGIANFGRTDILHDDIRNYLGSRYHPNISLYQQGLINIFLYV